MLCHAMRYSGSHSQPLANFEQRSDARRVWSTLPEEFSPGLPTTIINFGFARRDFVVVSFNNSPRRRAWASGEMADARGLGPRGVTLAGSSPVSPTIIQIVQE
jgi:hypothetical protein